MSAAERLQDIWTRASVQALAYAIHKASTPEDWDRILQDYGEIVYKTRPATLRKEYYYLAFGPDCDSATELPPALLRSLIGEDFEQKRRAYHSKPAGYVIDQPDCPVRDLSNVQSQYALSQFNILSHGKGIKVQRVVDTATVEIPPVVNLCIALSLVACQHQRGMFLWQRKKRKTKSGYSKWHRVPDLLLLDYVWGVSASTAFLGTTYAQKRDFLGANGRLKDHDVVLPFLLDFPGETLENEDDARVTADVDNIEPPRAAISIPGAAYIGWLDQLLPSTAEGRQKYYREEKLSESQPGFRREYIVPPRKRPHMRATSTLDMYKRAIEMLDYPIDNSLMFYQGVIALVRAASTE